MRDEYLFGFNDMELLDLLGDGDCHSGEALGAALGISRAAIWKQLQGLRSRGVEIEAVPGKGYRLVSALEPWDREALLGVIGEDLGALISELIIERRVSSTNNIVASRMADEPAGMVICLADEQTEGRGRRGREWFSPLSGNFYGTVGVRFKQGVAAVSGLSLAIGLAVARALKTAGVENVRLKWPNDLEVGGGKLGGVLIELQAEADGPCSVIVGIGVNLRLPATASMALGREVADVASCIEGGLNRNRVGGLLLREVLEMLRDYPQHGFAACQAGWSELDALRGLEVEVSGLGAPLTGTASGVDASGALMVQTPQGRIAVNSGEVSVRKAGA